MKLVKSNNHLMQNLQNNPDLMLLDLQTTRLIYKFLHTVNKKQTA